MSTPSLAFLSGENVRLIRSAICPRGIGEDEFALFIERRTVVLRRFLERVKHVATDGCWWWTGHRRANGYGAASCARRMVYAHRLAWVLEYGPLLAGEHVLHHCDNRPCVRPDHLFVGHARHNSHDMHQKGRRVLPKGVGNGRAVLTDEAVRSIRAASWATRAELAELFGVSKVTICNVRSGRTWSHVQAEARS